MIDPKTVITQHSGGYEDIEAFLLDTFPQLDWLQKSIDNAHGAGSTGEYANKMQMILLELKLPTINHSDWPKLCMAWELPEDEEEDKDAEEDS